MKELNSNITTELTKKLSEKNIIPPTLEMVSEYCKMRGNGIDAEEFMDFYSSKGWYVGKNKMVDWQSAIRTWERKKGFKFVPKLDLNGNLSYNDLKDKPILPEGGIKTVEGELIEVPSKLSDLENDAGFFNASNGIAKNLTINGLTSNGEFEIFGTSPHIDFHFNNIYALLCAKLL